MANRSRETFEFISVSHPQDSASWKRQVRSHAAKNSRARKQRVMQYQKDNRALQTREPHDPPEQRRQAEPVVYGPVVTVLGASRTDPFDSFIRKITKFESFLLDHFVRHVVLHVVTCYPLTTMVEEAEFRHGMATHWVQMAATDAGMLATLFLASCRNLACFQDGGGVYLATALRYKGQCIASLKADLASQSGGISDTTITKTLVLASEATLAGDRDAVRQHSDAATRMVAMRGGIESLGMSGFLKKLILWFIRDPDQEGNTLLMPKCIPSVSKTVAGFTVTPPDYEIPKCNRSGS